MKVIGPLGREYEATQHTDDAPRIVPDEILGRPIDLERGDWLLISTEGKKFKTRDEGFWERYKRV